MLNLESSVTSQLPPLNYMTWLTSYLFTIKLFTLSVVVEYGVVSWLMTIEAHRVRKFEAMKQMAAAMKLDNHAVKHAATDPAEEKVDKQGTIIVLEKSPEQVHEVYKLFDADLSGCINKHEIQLGFRKLGQYLSFDQVNRMFFRLGVEGESLQKADFHRLLMDLNDYLPGTPFTITYWERPPSIQVAWVAQWYPFPVFLVQGFPSKVAKKNGCSFGLLGYQGGHRLPLHIHRGFVHCVRCVVGCHGDVRACSPRPIPRRPFRVHNISLLCMTLMLYILNSTMLCHHRSFQDRGLPL